MVWRKDLGLKWAIAGKIEVGPVLILFKPTYEETVLSSSLLDAATLGSPVYPNGEHAERPLVPRTNANELRESTAGVQIHEIRFVSPPRRSILNIEACGFVSTQSTHHPIHCPRASEELQELVVLERAVLILPRRRVLQSNKIRPGSK